MKAKAATPSSKKDRRPTPDQMYLASKLNGEAAFVPNLDDDPYGPTGPHRITPAALQRWNTKHGVSLTTSALRVAWGHPPLAGIDNPWAYVDGILRAER